MFKIGQHKLLRLGLYGYIVFLLGAGLWPMNFWQENGAKLIQGSGLRLDPPAIAYTINPPEKLLKMREFTILIHLSSEHADQNVHGPILSYALDDKQMNFIIWQWLENFAFEMNSGASSPSIVFETPHVITLREPSWFALSFDSNTLSLYKNGRRVNTITTEPNRISGWNVSYPLVIGCDPLGRYSWTGNIYSISIFNRALTPEEIRNFPAETPNHLPVIFYDFQDQTWNLARDSGRGKSADLSIPERFKPYWRNFFIPPSLNFTDYAHETSIILINIAGFFPLGWLLSMNIAHKNISPLRALIIAVVTGLVISLIIEFSQAFLPNRVSNISDLINNPLGTAIGFFSHRVFKRHYSHRKTPA